MTGYDLTVNADDLARLFHDSSDAKRKRRAIVGKLMISGGKNGLNVILRRHPDFSSNDSNRWHIAPLKVLGGCSFRSLQLI